LAAGTINTIVGSGSLISFPTLLAFGYAPVVANVSNTVGLVPGSISGAFGYRGELAGQRSEVVRLGLVAAAGGLSGGVLLLALPPTSFQRVVPFLVLLAVVLVLVGPRLSRAMEAHRAAGGRSARPALIALIYLTSVYGGYFGAAQGVLFVGVLGIFLQESLQRVNALKNALTVLVNGIAALLFIAVAPVAWGPVVLLAIGSIAGGQVGARIGRSLPPTLLRAAIAIVGTIVGVRLLLG
jgi:uncharacterized membrane protein YfcA